VGTPIYSSNLPTSLPSLNPSTSPYLPHHPFAGPSIAKTLEPQRACGACGKLMELGEFGELVELAEVVELEELLELGELKKLLELVKVVELMELRELRAQNIKQSPHFEGKCFFSCF